MGEYVGSAVHGEISTIQGQVLGLVRSVQGMWLGMNTQDVCQEWPGLADGAGQAYMNSRGVEGVMRIMKKRSGLGMFRVRGGLLGKRGIRKRACPGVPHLRRLLQSMWDLIGFKDVVVKKRLSTMCII